MAPEDSQSEMVVEDEAKTVSDTRPVRLFREIWKEFTFGVGAWGTLRPLFTALLAAVPFLFLGQHVNRRHQKAIDWSLLQIPLALTIVLWFGLWLYSIFDAWREATQLISQSSD
tara:strand:+ start:16679 stop:17020 length:342 start_codon:yes stop_codon:yes gene_type:complete